MEESKIRVGEFRNSRGDHYGFNYYFETTLSPETGIIVPLPQVTPNKRSVNDIGWMVTNENAKIYGTLSQRPEANNGEDALWQEINSGDDVNKVISAIKVENNDKVNPCTVVIRVIMC